MGNHSKVITGQKYSTRVSAFLPKLVRLRPHDSATLPETGVEYFCPVITLDWFPIPLSGYPMIVQLYRCRPLTVQAIYVWPCV